MTDRLTIALAQIDPTVGDLDGNGRVDLIADFGAGVGVWGLMNFATWGLLNLESPDTMTAFDLDGRRHLFVKAIVLKGLPVAINGIDNRLLLRIAGACDYRNLSAACCANCIGNRHGLS